MYEIELGEGWYRVDTPNGPVWWGIPAEQPEPVEEPITIPEGYVSMGMMEGR